MTSAPFMTPGAGPVRAKVEKNCATFVVWLSRLPRAVPPIAVALLFFGGLVVSGLIGCLLILVVVAFMSLLTYLAWPSLAPTARLIRVAVLLAIAIFAVSRLF